MDNLMNNLIESLLSGLGVFLLVVLVISLIIIVFEVIALWKLFEKAGKPGWASIIPIYNTIILYEIIGYNWYYIFITFLSGIPLIGGVVVILFNISSNIKLAKSFNQTAGFGIGLAFLSPIFIPILAFSKNINYIGPNVNGDIDFNDLF